MSGVFREFISNAFKQYLQDQSIKLTFAAARTKEQNATAERKNRTLMDKVLRCLHSTGTPLQFWGDFFLAAIMINNCTPSRSNKGSQIPFLLHCSYKPNVKFFRKLGSLCWVFQELDARTLSPFGKLSPKSVPCILVGYASNSSAYRCVSISTGKFFESLTKQEVP